jgi:hypothetical protein
MPAAAAQRARAPTWHLAAGLNSMSERFVIVHRTYDPMQADMLGELLREAGVFARVTGTRSGALIGAAQNILEVHLAVPESQAGQATDFLEAYLAATPVAEGQGDDISEGGRDGDGAHSPAPRPLRPLLAAGSAFLTFGVGHLYSRRPATAVALLCGQLVAMAYLFIGDSWYAWTVGFTALAGIVGCDLVGAMAAARAHQSGVRRGRAWQAAMGAAYVSGALLVAHALGPHLTDPKAGDPTGGWRHVPGKHPLEKLDRPLQRDPSFPPLTSQHPANPAARR